MDSPGPEGFTDPAPVPLVTVQRADNGDLVIIINHAAPATEVMLSILRAMGAS